VGRVITLFYETEAETKEITVDVDLLAQQKSVVLTISNSEAVLPEVREAMTGVLNLLDAISDFAPELPGRESAEYPDDDQCTECKRWFRRSELPPAGVNKRYAIPAGKQLRGKCPACQVEIYS
jgi:hypothetical protein